MSATRDFHRWAQEIVNDPRYPVGLPRTEDIVALYVMLAEVLEEAEAEDCFPPDSLPLCWMPVTAARSHLIN